MKKLRHYTRKVIPISALRHQRFHALFSKPASKEVFDDKFIEGVQKRRDEVLKMSLKLYGIQVPIFALLMIALLPINAKISVLGITPEGGRSIREILVVVSALLGIAASLFSLNRAVLAEIVKVYAERRSKGNKEINEVLNVGYGVDYYILPPMKQVDQYGQELGWGFTLFAGVWAVGLVVLMIIAAVVSVTIHFAILWDVYTSPTYSRAASMIVIGVVLLCDFLSLGASFFHSSAVGVRDYTNLLRLSRVSEKDPAKTDEVYKDIARKYYRQSWLWRFLTRPKIPNKLPF